MPRVLYLTCLPSEYNIKILVQMVFDLFVQSGKAPPEDHAVPKAKREPPVVFYDPWQPVKLKPV